jgi:hypothetical protein
VTGRQVGDERARYGRKSPGERLEDLRETLSRFRLWIVAIAVLIAIGAWFALISRHVTVDRLEAGECLFIPTSSADDPTSSRPIGTEPEVEQVLFAGGAEDASCTASHGHEVMVADSVAAQLPAGEPVTQDRLRLVTQTNCTSLFQLYVGHPHEGSAFVTFAAVPTLDQWNAGDHIGVCLVARADGQWMTTPARGSGG